MKILYLGIGIFAIGFILHLLIWKIRIPKMQTPALLQIFFIVLATSICILELSMPNAFTYTEYLHIILFIISLVGAYVMTYTALEVDSPSLVMIMAVKKAGPSGLNKYDLFGVMSEERLIGPRVRDLVTAKMIFMSGERYKLTKRGMLFINIFIVYRKLLKRNKGG